MKITPHRALLHRWVVWLAVCAMFFMVLAPTVSHTLAWAQAGSTARLEVCTNQGMVSLADAPAEPDAPPLLNHCPFCLHATHPLAPAPNNIAYLYVRMGSYGVPWVVQAFLHFDKHYPPWVSRAPPASA